MKNAFAKQDVNFTISLMHAAEKEFERNINSNNLATDQERNFAYHLKYNLRQELGKYLDDYSVNDDRRVILQEVQKKIANFVTKWNIKENAKEAESNITAVMCKSEKDFDCIINNDNLSQQGRNFAYMFKYTFHRELRALLDASPEKIDPNRIQRMRANYIAGMIQRKTEYEYECEQLIQKQVCDKEIQKNLGKEVFEEAFNLVLQEIPGSCSYLVEIDDLQKK